MSPRPRKDPDIGRPFRRADGRWVVRYRVAPNQWRQKTIPAGEPVRTERQAAEWGSAWLAEKRQLGEVSPRSQQNEGPTVRELSKRWLKLRKAESDISEATKAANLSHFNNHIWPEFENCRVAGLAFEGARLGKWIRRLKGEKGKQTVRNIVSTFRSLLDFAKSPEAGQLLRDNPLRDEWFQKLLPKRNEAEGRQATIEYAPLKPEQVQKLLSSRKVPLVRRVRYAIVFTTPLRDGELAGLRWRDVDLDAEVPFFHVRQAVAIIGENGYATPQGPKSLWSRRKLPLHPAATQALLQWRDEGWEPFVCRRPDLHDPVFPRPDGGYRRPRSADDLATDLKACELPQQINGTKLHFHDARSCVSTWLTNEHVSEMLIRRLLGQAPRGAMEKNYIKRNDIMAALLEALKNIPLVWKR